MRRIMEITDFAKATNSVLESLFQRGYVAEYDIQPPMWRITAKGGQMLLGLLHSNSVDEPGAVSGLHAQSRPSSLPPPPVFNRLQTFPLQPVLPPLSTDPVSGCNPVLNSGDLCRTGCRFGLPVLTVV
jgi:hypothetical protein